MASNQGEFGQAKQYLEQALALHRQLGNRSGEADVLNMIGLLDYDLGDYSDARDRFVDALRLWQDVGDRSGLAIGLSNHGLALRALEVENSAKGQYRAALALFDEIDNLNGIAWCFEGLAAVAWAQGSVPQAARLAGSAERMRELAADPPPAEQQRRIDALLSPLQQLRTAPFVTTAWEAGKNLSREEAVALVLDTTGKSPE